MEAKYSTSHLGDNLPALKHDLKNKLEHLNHLLTQALNYPDQINPDFCNDLSEIILALRRLSELAQNIANQQSDLSSLLKESSEIISNILEAPIYV